MAQLITYRLSRICIVTLLAMLATGVVQPAAGTSLQRFVLAAGANNGGKDRAALRYAFSDAQHFTQVMEAMGGVAAERSVLLEEPTVGQFFKALSKVKETVRETRQPGRRVELILYYSGHADENGLLMEGDRVAYQNLRDQLDAVDADVHITVLDACASGAITRIKGGNREKAFLVDESSQVRGHAFLTSSSEDEAAQESDVIGGSYFTHHLVSGLRGAADVSGDGKVTLAEAYQHAFHETLEQTTDTRGGVQHPAYDIDLAGSGDVVMTDLREISAGLRLGENLDGRFYIRNDKKQLIVELTKEADRAVTIGLEPGIYDVHFEQPEALGLAKIDLRDHEQLELARRDFRAVDRKEVAALRGTRRRPSQVSLERRHRLQFHLGYVESGPRRARAFEVGTSNTLEGFLYGWWAMEHLMISLSLNRLDADISTEVSAVTNALFGVRYYFPRSSLRTPLRPYATAAVGTYVASVVGSFVGTETTPGGYVGAGLDIPIGRWFMLGSEIGYNIAADFDQPVGGRRNYSGLQINIGFSLTIGRGI